MTTLTVTTKGQVTLRKDLLKHLGVVPGDKVSIDLTPDGKATLSAAKTSGLDAFFGSLHRAGEPSLTLEEIDQAIRQGWAGKR